MLPIENKQPSSVRNPGRPDNQARVILPTRTPNTLFRGWGPKLIATAVTICTLALSNKPALASSHITIASSCSSADHGATLLSSPIPETPEGVGASGRTIVRVDVAASGRVERLEVAQSSGSAQLDFAAVRVAEQSQYAPASLACHAAGDSFLYSVTFEIE
ncbi:MAG: energy transducer TonB [Vulcanimicrobiaceae bacterium]